MAGFVLNFSVDLLSAPRALFLHLHTLDRPSTTPRGLPTEHRRSPPAPSPVSLFSTSPGA
ncbi:hypothetical protein M404DRAFT_993536 [Pisolithus tinctorius Marx 270]|uniref:Uncharacterized protein n=1 Tax=Pisolithus tinctorius Marx 270 TaxID=870435 RepID=A0A0C3PTK3_PISTI|nr:hypothetical protein M404DRAFT_993536 [Pisolithus tinctorius Marx 270]